MKLAISYCLFFFSCTFILAQGPVWSDVSARSQANKIGIESFRQASVNFSELRSFLASSQEEFLISLPDPDGGIMEFIIRESSIMAPQLQESYPQIRTYAGRGLGENSSAIARLDFTVKGFHAQILIPGKTFFIDPVSDASLDDYMVYKRSDYYAETSKLMPECTVIEASHNLEVDPLKYDKGNTQKGIKGGIILKEPSLQNRTVVGTQKRRYDLAVACTGEYAQFHGGTTAGALSAIVTTVNRVNGVFLRDLSIEMILVANNDDLIFLNGSTDPYSNTNTFAMLGQNQTTVDNEIGSGNYDIGHVFATGGGGVAYLNSPCNNSIKAGGVSSLFSPVGDPFDIDYVAHEMGHQWGANHTQNNNCNRSSSAAYEPGSASTIMGYAGICPPNLQNNSDDHFHNHSFNEMVQFSVNGNGNSCATVLSTGNTPPSLSLPSGGFTIPIGTPFELTAVGEDFDDDELTFCWEQYDLGPATSSGDNNLSNPSGNAPIFRSWSPTSDPTRVFPRITDLINNTTVIGERLPTYSRDLTFRCTVRDNSPDGGGVRDGEVAFEATSAAGPFVVTSPNTSTSWTGGSARTILWNVANTNTAPVNCSNVDIFLSTDGGLTYPISLASGVPNDGSHTIIAPNIPTSSARIKVKAANNIFFDISNSNFSIQPGIVNDLDAAFNGFISPQGEICGANFTPIISLLNLGSNTLTSLTITYGFTGQSNQTFNWTGSLSTGSAVDVILPQIAASNGFLNVSFSLPNGNVDENPSNDSGLTPVTTNDIVGLSLPQVNTFQSVSFPGTNWSLENPDGATTWERTTSAGGFGQSSACARIDFYNYNSPGEEDDIISPWIDLTEAGSPELDFDYAYARYSASFFDRMQVQIIESCSEEWVTLWDESNLNLATAGSITSPFTPTSSQWENVTIDLSSYNGSTVRIRFRGITGWGNNLYLDNIGITETAPPDCNGDAGGSAFLDNCGNCVGGNTGLNPCVLCPPGFFDNDGLCSPCPAGTFCPGDGNSYPCAAGTAQNQEGAVFCSNCPPGSFSSDSGATECDLCPGGTFSSESGAVECLDCPSGTVSDSGATQCDACGPGFFQNGNNCTPCPPGTFCPGDGNSYPCASGSAQNQEGSISCDLCPPGSFASEPGSQTCDLCPGGTFSQESGANTCLDCPAGTDSGPGAVICLELDCAGVPGGNSSLDECGVCDDNPANDNTTCLDCAGIPNGPNTIDQCGVCDADPSNDNSTCLDCAGVPNGNSTLDQCGVCDDNPDNDNQTCLDCAGVPNGESTVDQCGVCDDNPANDNTTCLDCAGIPNGPNTIDQCGVCDADPSNDNSTCLDCAGVPNGNSTLDQCGVCDDNPDNDNQTCLDCAGVPNGESTVDECGVCDDNPANDNTTCLDCAGIPNGPNTIDQCGVCDADPSNDNSTCLDCAGVPNGNSTLDQCGVCDDNPDNDNQTCLDCAGVPNGESTVDECGVCDDNSANDNTTCLDCAGIPNGPNTIDQCGVCDADPSNDNLTCLDCAGVPNGNSTLDQCGVCDDNPDNDNQTCLDCAGVPNGESTVDECGVCDDNPANDNETCTDCAGIVNGSAFFDSCGDCVGGTTGLDACTINLDLIIDIDALCLPRNARVAFYLPGSTILLEEFEASISSEGTFSIETDLESGNYDIYVKVESHLSKGIYDFALQGDEENSLIVDNLKIGDVNGDDFINFFDGSGLNPFFGSSIGQPNYSSTADLNCDGTVNFFDGSALNIFFGEAGEEP